TGVRKRCALARCACSKQNSSCRCSLGQADSLNIRTDITHGVVDSHQGGNRATWRADVHGDVTGRVHTLENEQLRHDVIGGGGIDLCAQEDNALFEKLGIWVGFLRTLRGLLNKRWQYVAG